LIERRWPSAYDNLAFDSQAWCNREQFARLGESFLAEVGFQLTSFHFRACTEHGTDATAHVTLRGSEGGRPRQFRTAISLQHADGAWRIVLPANFGRARAR
jgi:hypothetical protein